MAAKNLRDTIVFRDPGLPDIPEGLPPELRRYLLELHRVLNKELKPMTYITDNLFEKGSIGN